MLKYRYIAYIFFIYTAVIVMFVYNMANHNQKVKIEKVKAEQQNFYQTRIEYMDRQIQQHKDTISRLQQNDIITTMLITKKDGERIKKVIVNHTRYKVLYVSNTNGSSSIDASNIVQNTNVSTIESKKEETTKSLKYLSISAFKQSIPISNDIHIELGLRIFKTPFWCATLIGVKDKALSIGLRMEI